ncbi:MAG TPA: PIG-L deacetylase family protein [Egibacteraceae bacterium]
MTTIPQRLAGAAKPAVRRAWRAALTARAVDVTTRSAQRSALVLAPHPDDETIGCGATIARKRAAGSDVHVVVAADGRSSHRASRVISSDELVAIRRAEAVEACAILGVPEDRIRFLGHPDDSLRDRVDALADQLAAIVREVQPDEVLVTCEHDWHVDHQGLNLALRRALRRGGVEVAAAAYPVWWWADGPWTDSPPGSGLPARARRFVAAPLSALRGPRPQRVTTGRFLEVKRAALAAYRSQTSNLTGEPDWAVMSPQLLQQFLGSSEISFPISEGVR